MNTNALLSFLTNALLSFLNEGTTSTRDLRSENLLCVASALKLMAIACQKEVHLKIADNVTKQCLFPLDYTDGDLSAYINLREQAVEDYTLSQERLDRFGESHRMMQLNIMGKMMIHLDRTLLAKENFSLPQVEAYLKSFVGRSKDQGLQLKVNQLLKNYCDGRSLGVAPLAKQPTAEKTKPQASASRVVPKIGVAVRIRAS